MRWHDFLKVRRDLRWHKRDSDVIAAALETVWQLIKLASLERTDSVDG